MIRAIGIDLDGTLLNDKKEICQRNIEMIRKAQEKGIKIVLCSGRSADGMQRELKALSLQTKGQYAVGLNGGIVFEADTGRLIYKNTMDPRDALQAIETGRKVFDAMNMQVYNGINTFVEHWDDTTEFYQKATGSQPRLIPDAADFYQDVVKVGYFARGEFDYSLRKIRKLKEVLTGLLPQDVSVAITAPYLVETYDRQTDKGRGMKILAEKLGLDRSEIMGIGDLENDMPLIEYAGFGVVMANGSQVMKEAADYITKDNNNEGGVAEAIEKFVINR